MHFHTRTQTHVCTRANRYLVFKDARIVLMPISILIVVVSVLFIKGEDNLTCCWFVK